MTDLANDGQARAPLVSCTLASIIVAHLLSLRTNASSSKKPPALKNRADDLLNHVTNELGTELASTKIPLNIKKSLHRTNEALNLYFNILENVCVSFFHGLKLYCLQFRI